MLLARAWLAQLGSSRANSFSDTTTLCIHAYGRLCPTSFSSSAFVLQGSAGDLSLSFSNLVAARSCTNSVIPSLLNDVP